MEIKQEEYKKRESQEPGEDVERFKEIVKGEKEEVFITDCSIDTDLELLIPDTYIPQISEKIRLYKELDAITNEAQLEKFIEALVDRFGKMPEQLEQLTYVVRLRWIAIKLGFERIVIKNGIMLVYFVHNQNSPYYRTDLFANILNYINNNPQKIRIKEQNNKLMMRVMGVDTMDKAYNIVNKILIFAP